MFYYAVIGGQFKINKFSFQTFTVSLQKQLIINVNKVVKLMVNVSFYQKFW